MIFRAKVARKRTDAVTSSRKKTSENKKNERSDGLTSSRKKTSENKPKNDDETKPVKRFKEELEKLNQEAQNAALIARPRLQLKRKLRLASDCAGLGSDLVALRLFGCQHLVTSSAWSDNDSTKRKMYRAVCRALGCSIAPCCKDMTTRDASSAPGADIYVAGWPCPSFSALGKKRCQRQAGTGWSVRSEVHHRPQTYHRYIRECERFFACATSALSIRNQVNFDHVGIHFEAAGFEHGRLGHSSKPTSCLHCGNHVE